MNRFRIALSAIAILALAIFLTRDSLHQLLADWTGEEDLQFQLRGLGYLALSAAQPARDTADLAPMKYADVNPFGVNTFLEQEVEETKIRTTLQMIRDAGFHWIRQEFPWEDIEKPGKGQFWDTKYNQSTWDKYDRIVNLASEYGIEIIARLDHPPAWTRHDGRARGDFAPPDDYADYGDLVAAVVARYRGKIRFYQLWNEPNIYPEWGEQPVSARDYVRLLKIGYTRAKQTDPSVVILSAGLAQTIEQGPKNVSDLTFLQQMYAAGVRGYFDILAVQDYGLFTGPGDRRLDPERTNFSRPIMIREIMVKNGDADTPIWAMEVGWNAVPPGMDAPFGRVTEQQQARYAVQAYERAQNEWSWMGAMMDWFFKRADNHEKNQPMYYFRMLDPDFTAQPVYAAMKDYIAQARVVTPGFRSTSDWAIDWYGAWETQQEDRAYFGEYKIGRLRDSVDFVFRGTDLDLVALQNPYGGAARVQIDNQSPRETELWRTDSGVGGRIALARDLDDGEHRVTITVMRAPVAINGFIVQRGNAWWVKRVAVVGVLGGLVVGGLVWRRSRCC
ncbi:MAG: cellulase family glycosylhydrolase [Chloroflexota bacterium]|nr:cellulase family glycosylhydrolase [Chloroflexota bacterium]